MRTYKLSSTELQKIANLCKQEQGSLDGAAAEASLAANILETNTYYSGKFGIDIYSFMRNSGWFYKASYYMDNGNASEQYVEKIRDILAYGNRTLPQYVDEHDCFSDIKSVTNNGKPFPKTDRSQYKRGVTIIKNTMGSTYTFYAFPAEGSDPFGYTEAAYKKVMGDKTVAKVDHSDAINRLIATATAEVGYLEKASASNLDDKKKNAGDKNYTKYARDLFPDLQGEAWCDMFVDWCFYKTFGKEAAKKMLGGFEAYTPSSAQYFKDKKRWYKAKPQAGDIIFFKNSERICHTGIVEKITAEKVYTIEGNTSNGSEVVANGGAVCKKNYDLGNSRIAGYGRPDYSLAPAVKDTVKKEAAPAPAKTSSASAASKKKTPIPTGIHEEPVAKGRVKVKTALNVRKWAGMGYDLTSFTGLANGTIVDICSGIYSDAGELWYYIQYKGKHGFVNAKYIEIV